MTIAQVMSDMGLVSVEGQETLAWGALFDSMSLSDHASAILGNTYKTDCTTTSSKIVDSNEKKVELEPTTSGLE
jgi:hypothetical protein